MHRATLPILVIFLASFVARAEVDPGLTAYNAGNYEEARIEWQAQANRGSATAAFNLGLLYYHGKGVAEDHAQAAAWYEKAADRGFPRAQFHYGDLLERGDGVERDLIRAMMWFYLAAEEKFEGAKKRRKQVARQLNPKEISFAEMYARMWKEERREREKADED